MGVRFWSHYASIGRNTALRLGQNAVITTKTDESKQTIIVRNGDIAEVITKDGRKTRHVAYGKFVKEYENGHLKLHQRIKAETNLAMIPNGEWKKEKCFLGDYEGTLKQYCLGGTVVREEFRYKNRRLAYRVTRSSFFKRKQGIVKYPDGKPWFEFSGSRLDFSHRNSAFANRNNHWQTKQEGAPVLWMRNPAGEFSFSQVMKDGNYSVCIYDKKGNVSVKGEVKNRQKQGEWIENGVKTFYLSGVKVNHRLYTTPAEKLDSAEIMAIENIQLRTSFCAKKGYGTILKDLQGKVIDTAGEYELYELPITKPADERADKVIHLLKVKCPSTGAYYTLRVPPNVHKVEDARQWTFRVDSTVKENKLVVEKPIEFTVET